MEERHQPHNSFRNSHKDENNSINGNERELEMHLGIRNENETENDIHSLQTISHFERQDNSRSSLIFQLQSPSQSSFQVFQHFENSSSNINSTSTSNSTSNSSKSSSGSILNSIPISDLISSNNSQIQTQSQTHNPLKIENLNNQDESQIYLQPRNHFQIELIHPQNETQTHEHQFQLHEQEEEVGEQHEDIEDVEMEEEEEEHDHQEEEEFHDDDDDDDDNQEQEDLDEHPIGNTKKESSQANLKHLIHPGLRPEPKSEDIIKQIEKLKTKSHMSWLEPNERTIRFFKDLEIMTKQEREFYLLIALKECHNYEKDKSSDPKKKRVVYNYKIQPFGKISRDAFCEIFGIRTKHLKNLQIHLFEKDSVVPRVHGNVGKVPQNRKLNQDHLDFAERWARELARQEGQSEQIRVRKKVGSKTETSRIQVTYLSQFSSFVQMYKAFKESFEREFINAKCFGPETLKKALQKSCPDIRIRKVLKN